MASNESNRPYSPSTSSGSTLSDPSLTGSGSSLGGSSGSTLAGTSSMDSSSSSMGSSSSGSSDRYLTGLFPDRDSAERAYQGVIERGYDKDDVNLVMSDETRKKHFGEDGALGGRETELGNKAAEGAGIGAGIGGTVGAIAAAVAAVGTSLALPGLGLVIAGPVAAALAGAGAGGAVGSLVGALIGMNIPEERVKQYEQGIKEGGILMGVKPRSDDDASHLENHWRTAQGRDIFR